MAERIKKRVSAVVVWGGLAIGLAAVGAGCWSRDAESDAPLGTAGQALNNSPRIGDFAVIATNSVSAMDRAKIHGGDVGARSSSSGPFLVSGYQAAFNSSAGIDLSHTVLANQVFLNGAALGDVEANRITTINGATFTRQLSFITPPALPVITTASPGIANLTVNGGTTLVLSASARADVVVNGTLRLLGGTYDFASLTIGNDARLEASSPVLARIRGRIATGDRGFIGPASGATLRARDIRITVAAANGGAGGVTDTPSTIMFGNGVHVTASYSLRTGRFEVASA